MIVWRIQNEKGVGPYAGGAAPGSLYGFDRHPSPIVDFPEWARDVDRKNWKFACPTAKTLVRWFNSKERRQLREAGYAVVKLHVASMVVSDSGRQCIYKET